MQLQSRSLAHGLAQQQWRFSKCDSTTGAYLLLQAGQGTCFPAVKRGDVYDVRCLGPEEFLTPGQVQPC